MGRLTTHVLDTANGVPGAGIRVQLFRTDDLSQPIAEATTNSDGRCDRPLLEGADFAPASYELRFHVGDYFRSRQVDHGEPAFLDIVPIRFGVTDGEAHYHVPLLVSPWSYTTYRGS